jgi:hypothetical protein
MDTAILIVSCDKYSDIWDIFFKLFFYHWEDCNYPIYLGSNSVQFPDERINNISVGADISWGSNLRSMLTQIRENNIILLLEDFLLLEKVDSERIKVLEEILVNKKIGCLRLTPNPPPTKKMRKYPGLGEVLKGDFYRISAQAAIWNKDFLSKLSQPSFSAWDFEVDGTFLSYELPDRVWSVYNRALNYNHCLEKGKWIPPVIEKCRELGFSIENIENRGFFKEPEINKKKNIRDMIYSVCPGIIRFIRRSKKRKKIIELLNTMPRSG